MLAGAMVACLAACTSAPPASVSVPAATAPDPQVTAALAEVSAARIESRVRRLVAFGTRHTLSQTDSELRGIGAARRWIEAELQRCSAAAGSRLRIGRDEHLAPAGARLPRDTPIVNVVATLPGDDPQQRDRVLVVSGHYDSRVSDVMDATADAPGADDDASGVAAVLELACVMASRHYGATLVFLAVAGEEQGLLGAAHWAEQARQTRLDVEAMITNDIIGTPVGEHGEREPQRVRLFADGLMPLLQMALVPDSSAAGPASAASTPPALPADPATPTGASATSRSELRSRIAAQVRAGGAADFPANQLGRHIKEAGERYLPGFDVRLVQRQDRFLRGGDHLPFLERGFAAARLTEPFEDFSHQHQDVRDEGGRHYGDDVAFVDFGYIADVARINLAALATLALAPRPPRNARIETLELGNDSTLRWDASGETAVAGYRILWRDTTSPVWQHGRDIGLSDVATVPVSKDDVVFGVAALSRSGHASLASFPLPARK